MRDKAKDKARELIASVKEYPSGYRSYADTEVHVRPLTNLENELIDVLKLLLEEVPSSEGWEYRAAEVFGDRIETWGPKGNPDSSWATFEEAAAGAAKDEAFVVRRRTSGPWERVQTVV